MKYIKAYEDIEEELQQGDYVIYKTESGYDRFDKFIDNNLGIFIGPTYTGPN
jgi:hypothetical protein